MIGLTAPRQILFQRINHWLEKRLEQGLIGEVEDLLKKGVSPKRLYDLGLEYRFVSQYILRKLKRQDLIEKLKSAIHDFAKSQLTFLKKDKRIIWFDISRKNYKLDIEKRIAKWLNLSKRWIKRQEK